VGHTRPFAQGADRQLGLHGDERYISQTLDLK